MKTSLTKTTQTLIGLMVVFFGAQVNAKTCPDSAFVDDEVLDLTTLSANLEKYYDDGYDVRREIDRSKIQPNDPMYALNGIGKVTVVKSVEGQQDFENSVRSQEQSSWGTGFLISPCHMITNHHVVSKTEQNIVGRKMNFSFGENNTGSDFNARSTGQVVGSNKQLDYAIVKISSLKNKKNVPFLFPNFSNIDSLNTKISLGAGFPVKSKGNKSHKIFGMKSELYEASGYINGAMTITPGNSGSPMMYAQSNRLIASGLAVGGGQDSNGVRELNSTKRILGLPEVGIDLNEKSPALFDEIRKSIATGQCE